MGKTKPLSFKILLLSVSVAFICFFLISILPDYGPNAHYIHILHWIVFLAFTSTPIGIYLGYKFKTKDEELKNYNYVGTIGNSIIFFGILSLLIYFSFFLSHREPI